jgi:hypothetical protein
VRGYSNTGVAQGGSTRIELEDVGLRILTGVSTLIELEDV